MRFPRTFNLLPLTIFALFLTTLAHADFQDGGDAYLQGDYATALKEFQEAAVQGHRQAQANLGFMYHYGRGVLQDDAQARKWYLKAATQGDVYVQIELGDMYKEGRDQKPDYVQAHMWYNLAAFQGQGRAAKYGEKSAGRRAAKKREQIAKKMTPAQITEAQRLARNWLAQHQT